MKRLIERGKKENFGGINIIQYTSMDILQKAKEIKAYFLKGQITYDEAVSILTPFIEQANERIVVIAKQYGNKPFKITATKLLR